MSPFQQCLSTSVSHTHHPGLRAQPPWSPHWWPESELLEVQIRMYHCPSAQNVYEKGIPMSRAQSLEDPDEASTDETMNAELEIV